MIRKIRAVIPKPQNWGDAGGLAHRFWVFGDSGEYCEIQLTTSDFESYKNTLTVAWHSTSDWPTLTGHQVMAALPVPGNYDRYKQDKSNEYWVFDNAGQVCRIKLQIQENGSVKDSFVEPGGAWHSAGGWHSLEGHRVATFVSHHSTEVDERFPRPNFPFDEYWAYDVEGDVASFRINRQDYRDDRGLWGTEAGGSNPGHKVISSIPVPGNLARINKTRTAEHWLFDDAGNVSRVTYRFDNDGAFISGSAGEWRDASTEWPSLNYVVPAPVITSPASGTITGQNQNLIISGSANIANSANAVVMIFSGQADISREPGKVVDGKWSVALKSSLPFGPLSVRAYVSVERRFGPPSGLLHLTVSPTRPVIQHPVENGPVAQAGTVSGQADAAGLQDAEVRLFEGGSEISQQPARIQNGVWKARLKGGLTPGEHSITAFVYSTGTRVGLGSDVRQINVFDVPAPVIVTPGEGGSIPQGGTVAGNANISNDAGAFVRIFIGNEEVSQAPAKIEHGQWTAHLKPMVPPGERALTAYVYVGEDYGPVSNVRKVNITGGGLPTPTILIPVEGHAIAQGGMVSGTAEVADSVGAAVRVFDGENDLTGSATRIQDGKWTVHLGKSVTPGMHAMRAFVYLGQEHGQGSDIRNILVVALPAPVILTPAEGAHVLPGSGVTGTADVPDGTGAVVRVLSGNRDIGQAPGVIKDRKWSVGLLSSAAGPQALKAVVELGKDWGAFSAVRNIDVAHVTLPAPVILTPAEGTEISQGGQVTGTAEIADGSGAVVRVVSGNREIDIAAGEIKDGKWSVRLQDSAPVGPHALRAVLELGRQLGPFSVVRNIKITPKTMAAAAPAAAATAAALPAPAILTPAEGADIAQGGEVTGEAKVANGTGAMVHVESGNREIDQAPSEVKDGKWSVRLQDDAPLGQTALQAFISLGNSMGPSSAARNVKIIPGPVTPPALPAPAILTPAEGARIMQGGEVSGTAGIADGAAVVRVTSGNREIDREPGQVRDGKWSLRLLDTVAAGSHALTAYLSTGNSLGTPSAVRNVQVVAWPVPLIISPAPDVSIEPGGVVSGTAVIADDMGAVVKLFERDAEVSQAPAKVENGQWTAHLKPDISAGPHQITAYIYVGTDRGRQSSPPRTILVGPSLPVPVITIPDHDGPRAPFAQGGILSGTADIDNPSAVVKVFSGTVEVSAEPGKVVGKAWSVRLKSNVGMVGDLQLTAYVYIGDSRGKPSAAAKVSIFALPVPVITVPDSDGVSVWQGGTVSGTADISDAGSAVVKVFAGQVEVSAEPGRVVGKEWSVRLKPDVAVGEQELKAFVYIRETQGPGSDVRRVRVSGGVKLELTPQVSAASVVAGGEPVTFSWTVVNKGPSVAERVVVSAAFPPGVVLDLSSVKPVAQEGGNNALQWLAVGDLQPGQSVTVSVAAVMAPRLPASRVEPVAWVSADNPDADHLEIQAAVGPVAAPVDVQARVKLAFTGGKAVPAEVVAGTSGPVDVTYSWNLGNSGPSDSGPVTVKATVAEGAVLKAGQEGWNLTDGKNAIRVFDSLPVHGSVPVSVVASVPTQGAEEPVTVTVEANAATADKDTGQPARAQDSASTQRVARVALTLVSPDPVTVVAGEPSQVSFVWKLTNAGPSTARQLALQALAPADMEFGESAGWMLSEGNTVASRVIESLAAAASVDLTLAGMVHLKAAAEASDGPLLTVRSATPDVNTPAQQASASKAATVKVTSRAVLEIAEARAFPVEVRPGSDLQYAWQVKNNGPSTAVKGSVQVKIGLPTGVRPHSEFKVQKGTDDLYTLRVDAPLAPGESGWVTFYASVDSGAAPGDASASALPLHGADRYPAMNAVATISAQGAEAKLPPKKDDGGGFWGWLLSALAWLFGVITAVGSWLLSAPIPSSAPSAPENEGNDSNEDEDDKTKRTRLGFRQAQASPDPVAVGKTVTFSWTLANTGKHPAYGVVGSITLPTTGVSNPQPSDGVVVTGSVATFTLDELAANAEKKLSVTLTVDANAPKELEATASAGAANATSPRKTLTTHVSPQVKVEGTAAPARTVAGGETTYVWTVVNDSTTLEVPDVTLTAVLPPAAKVTRVDASHYGTVQDGKITWPKTLLAAGGQLTRTVTVALSPDVTTIEAVTATATAPQLAEVTSQPVAVQIDTPETYLQLTARSTPEQATLASKVTYELTASNAGPSALSGATLTLTPTPHVTLSEATTQTGNEPPRSAPLTTAESGYTLDLPTLLPVAQQAAEIDYQVVELVPGLPPASPTVNGTYSGRIVTADAIFPTLTAQQITDRKNTGHFDDVINYQARGSVVAAAVQGNDHTVDATDVRVIGIDLDLRGMNNKLVILHLGTLNVSGILGDNNTLNVSNIRVIGVRAKIDLGSRTQLIISGGSINADVINGSTNHVKADKVSAAAVLLQYYANGKAIPTLPKEASTVQGPGTSTPVAITVR